MTLRYDSVTTRRCLQLISNQVPAVWKAVDGGGNSLMLCLVRKFGEMTVFAVFALGYQQLFAWLREDGCTVIVRGRTVS